METPEVVKMLTSDDILDMKQEELKVELEKFGQDVKGLTKVQLQKALLKLIQSPSASPKANESGVQAEKLKLELAEKEKQRQHQLQMKELGGSFERLTRGYFEDGAQGLSEEHAERTGHTTKFN